MRTIGNTPVGGEVRAVASGALPNGKPVIINADGTVSVVDAEEGAVGSPVVFESVYSDDMSATFDSSSNKVVIAYRDGGNSSYGTAIVGTVSGTSISFGTAVVFESAGSYDISATFDSSSNKVVIAYTDIGNSSYGTSVVFQNEATNLTSENYIGMSTGGTYADGSSATVDIIGSLSTNQSGLTAGQSYYVQVDGTIDTTPATPEVFAGTAISATSLVVKT